MESAIPTCDTGKPNSNVHIRRTGINPNCWYMIAKSSEVGQQPVKREIWRQSVVLFRTAKGELHALEDRCAHRFVSLSFGRVIQDRIECAYHGWQFNGAGQCVYIPTLSAKPSLPNCRVRSFPLVEKHGFVWIFPGDPQLSHTVAPMEMKEWDDISEIPSVAKLTCRAHFSYLVENLMDMYHGSLHAQYQVWTAQALQGVLQSENQVTATYQATTYYRVKSRWSIFQLAIPSLRKLHSAPLTVTYDYPNWKARLGDDFRIYCVICPVNERLTEAYLIHYTSIGKFRAMNHLPTAARRLLRRALNNVAQKLLTNLVRQDVLMIEDEQRAFDESPLRQPFEVNLTIHRVQQLMRRQAAEERLL